MQSIYFLISQFTNICEIYLKYVFRVYSQPLFFQNRPPRECAFLHKFAIFKVSIPQTNIGLFFCFFGFLGFTGIIILCLFFGFFFFIEMQESVQMLL